MSKLSKALQSASVSGAAGLNVEDVFSTYLWEGTGQSKEIVNGIDLLNEGGMVWIKARNQNLYDNSVYDTERGSQVRVVTNNDLENSPRLDGLTNFRSTGFSVGIAGDENGNGDDMVSWSWRKAPRFFDCVTYTGPGTGAAFTVNHNLGSVPGVIILKKTSASQDWAFYHRSIPNQYLILNLPDAAGNGAIIDNVTSSSFRITVAGSTWSDADDYVAYLFAHNDGDGEFGPTGDQDIIKCGSYTGNGSKNTIDLGFEPQWLMVRRVIGNDWVIVDNMRGMTVGVVDGAQYLVANESDAESTNMNSTKGPYPTSTGFELDSNFNKINYNNSEYIYMAIRRGPMAVPESATDVFAAQPWAGTGVVPNFNSGFPVDMMIHKNKTVNSEVISSARLTQQHYMETSTSLLLSPNVNYTFDYQDGYYGANTNANFISWAWRRSPNFFDALFYSGNSVAGRQVPHNLEAVPEMIWVKRTDGAGNWWVYHKDQQASTISGLRPPENSASRLDLDNIAVDGTNYWNDTLPSSTAFTVGDLSNTNGVTNEYMAYLFTSLAGISKCGGYIGNGTTLSIDCGFTAGTRFVLIKRTNATGGWFVFDSLRGMSSGNDSTLELNDSAPEITNEDVIEATTTGFNVINSGSTVDTNDLNDRYIFYAIAN